MKQVLILLYPGVAAGQVCGMQDYFRFCNDLARFQNPEQTRALYQVQLVDLEQKSSHQSGALSFKCVPWQLDHADVLIVPGSYAHHPTELQTVLQLFSKHPLLQQAHQLGIPIAASCNGSFALAATGLLDGKTATTCWFLADAFRQLFPKVSLLIDDKVCQQDLIYTAGATNAYIQLCLALTQQHYGSRFSQQMAKIMLTDPQCSSQTPYLSLPQLSAHPDDKVFQIQQFLRKNLAKELELADIAAHFSLTPRTLLRRFKQHTGDTPMAYLQKLRIEKAKQLLESSLKPIEQLLPEIGYEDLSSFRKLFQQYTSLTPKAYRDRFYLAEL
jgi:transcriptional regulator GlxA family with amidase domain